MKKSILLLLPLILILIGVLASFVWWKDNTSSFSSDETKVRFVIPKGKDATLVGIMLEEKGLIKSSLAFKIYVQVFDRQGEINAGEFLLSPSMSLKDVVDALGEGPAELWITIPEGLRREEVVEKVITGLEMEDLAIENFRNEFLALSVGKEGYLFPDTYLFPRDATPEMVVNAMLANFDKRFPYGVDYNFPHGLTKDEVVTLASIVEKETKTDEERPVVAGIYFNRMEIGQPLQADATVQYALGSVRCVQKIDCEWWIPPTREDYKYVSPYNTYTINGLPEAPIANPGISSLNAVLKSKHSEYYYYIHDNEGKVHFARTKAEHDANVAKYLY